jgi:hypothetical protein
LTSSNSQYAKSGSAFDEKADDVKLVKASNKVIDELSGRRAPALAESKTGC